MKKPFVLFGISCVLLLVLAGCDLLVPADDPEEDASLEWTEVSSTGTEAPVFLNGWVNIADDDVSLSNYEKLSFAKASDSTLHIVGAVYKETASFSSSTVFSLPEGYRPRHMQSGTVTLMDGGWYNSIQAVVYIMPTGEIRVHCPYPGTYTSARVLFNHLIVKLN